MRLSTKGRYAVMAMADLAGNATNAQCRRTGRWRWPISPQRQEISLSYLEQLFAKLRRGGLVTSVRGPGGGYRLSRPSRRAAHRRHHPGGGRAHRRHPLQDRQRQGLHQDRRALRHPRSVGRAGPADPCLPVVGVAGRCGGAPGAGPRQALQRHQCGARQRDRGRLSTYSHALSGSQCHFAAAPRGRGGDDACAWRSAAIRPRCTPHGRAARAMVEEAREQVAALAGAQADDGDLHQRRHRSQRSGAVRRGAKARWQARPEVRASRACSSRAIEHASVLATADAAGGTLPRRAAVDVCR